MKKVEYHTASGAILLFDDHNADALCFLMIFAMCCTNRRGIRLAWSSRGNLNLDLNLKLKLNLNLSLKLNINLNLNPVTP